MKCTRDWKKEKPFVDVVISCRLQVDMAIVLLYTRYFKVARYVDARDKESMTRGIVLASLTCLYWTNCRESSSLPASATGARVLYKYSIEGHLPRTPIPNMASSICLRCLSRPLVQAEQTVARPAIASQASSFSTSTPLSANPPKKKGAPIGLAKKGGTSYKQGRVGGKAGKSAGGARNAGSGERKMLRKRVVLSNTNALEIQGMQDFTAENLADAGRLNQVMGLSNETVDALRANEAFKPTQGWSMFRRPATLVRKETVDMGQLVEKAEKNTARKVIYGDRGSGKSVLMLQAMAMAHLKNWVVIHIPEGKRRPS